MSASRIVRGLRASLLLGLLALPLGCVNPFKPADPEPPSGASVPEEFGSPDELMETMSAGIENRTLNGANAYLHALAESTSAGERAFRALYDPIVKQSWLSDPRHIAPEPWDLSLERRLPGWLFTRRPNAAEYLFQLTPDRDSPSDDVGSLTALVHRKYRLITWTTAADTDTIAIGIADLSLQFNGSRWSVFRWNDRVDPAIGAIPANPDHRTFSWRRPESL